MINTQFKVLSSLKSQNSYFFDYESLRCTAAPAILPTFGIRDASHLYFLIVGRNCKCLYFLITNRYAAQQLPRFCPIIQNPRRFASLLPHYGACSKVLSLLTCKHDAKLNLRHCNQKNRKHQLPDHTTEFSVCSDLSKGATHYHRCSPAAKSARETFHRQQHMPL